MEYYFIVGLIALVLFLFKGLSRKKRRDTFTGKAYVIDGDTIKVNGQAIRLSGLDAPELDQPARNRDGYWYPQGKYIKSAMIKKIGGKQVQVKVEGYDNYDRIIGTVTYQGKDVGAWLVRNGYAISAYGDHYKHLEREARQSRRGMWGDTETYDPRAWRHR